MRNKKVVLVTGASSDIGIELISKVAESYSLIIAQYLHLNDKLKLLKEKYGDKIILIKANLLCDDDVDKIICIINQNGIVVDHVVHLTALKAVNSQFRKESWNQVTDHMAVSVKSIYRLLQEILPKMVKQKYGKVVFLLTSYLDGVPPKYQSSYVISKYALLGLMKSLSVEYIDYGITVNSVSPDMIETKFLEDLPHWVPEQNAKKSLLGRNFTVDDIVPAFQYLLSDGANAVTGLNMVINNKL